MLCACVRIQLRHSSKTDSGSLSQKVHHSWTFCNTAKNAKWKSPTNIDKHCKIRLKVKTLCHQLSKDIIFCLFCLLRLFGVLTLTLLFTVV